MTIPNYHALADNSVICLLSPTASGKTDLAFKLSQTNRFEIISVDSALIYQDMNIGTAKPTFDELKQFPHHLVNIISPIGYYSVANFVCDVEQLINQIHQRGKIPLLVGGTMMYYMALFDGISNIPQSNEQIRKQVNQWRLSEGNQALYDYLLKNDPIICQKLKPSDTQRISRAVEVHKQTGKAMSEWQAMPKVALSHHPKYQWHGWIVMPDRRWLHQRIEQRLDMMWQLGLVDEVIGLLDKYPSLHPNMPSMRCVGYRQVLEYLATINHPILQGRDDFCALTAVDCMDLSKKPTQNAINACQVMKNKALYATRQLAKRQYTWLRQLSTLGIPTTDVSTYSHNLTITSFDSIQQIEKHLL